MATLALGDDILSSDSEEATQEQESVATLQVLEPKSRYGEVFELYDGENTIGRHEEKNRIIIKETYISGCHAQIDINSEQQLFIIKDLGSANKTFIRHTNGKKTKLVANRANLLQSGDIVVLGKLQVRLLLVLLENHK